MSKILKNNTANPVVINDVGITIPASSQYVLNVEEYLLWAASSDVITFIGDSTLTVNDGSVDLSISDGVDLIKGLFPKEINVLFNEDGMEKQSFLMNVARGLIPNMSKINIFGQNPSVSSSATDVWSFGGTHTQPTTNSTLTVVSSNNSDKPSSTGAHLISIEGLDSNYLEITEIVSLNGTTIVNTTNSFSRVNSAKVLTSGSYGSNLGNITIKHGSLTVGYIEQFNSQTTSTIFTVPSNKVALIIKGYFSADKPARADFRIAPFDATLGRLVTTSGLALHLSDNPFVYEIRVPFLVPPKTDLKIRANTKTGSSSVSAGYEIILIDI